MRFESNGLRSRKKSPEVVCSNNNNNTNNVCIIHYTVCDDLLTVLSNSMLVIPALLPINAPLYSQRPTRTHAHTQQCAYIKTSHLQSLTIQQGFTQQCSQDTGYCVSLHTCHHLPQFYTSVHSSCSKLTRTGTEPDSVHLAVMGILCTHIKHFLFNHHSPS